ncbi:hypothetical protein K458DRAFT_396872 [Lentithecium fluviatile CBS 122367]|uniref:Uncharacterized protein n=1 Tax=Lentithecium fluviatile CBS 122367 TaxID=1168545 RepID=A0A6G1IEP6_9PLEO|nr:hypothetical protein K458DRAFT_396872 [Lentithecium fluviatile CBS 122367]
MFFHLLHFYDAIMARSRSVRRNSLPYSSHPLYKLRKITLIAGVIGVLLDLWTIGALVGDDEYAIPPFLCAIVVLLVSIAFVSHDLVAWAAEHHSDSDSNSLPTTNLPSTAQPASSIPPQTETNNPPNPTLPHQPRSRIEYSWPSRRLVITDLLLSFILAILFWTTAIFIMNGGNSYYRHQGQETFEAYANLCTGVACVAHVVAFWKELVARKKKEWEREVEERACEACGFVRAQGAEQEGGMEEDENEGWGPTFFDRLTDGAGKITLPKWATGPRAASRVHKTKDGVDIESEAAAVREPLLATPDESGTEVGGPSGSYGTLGQSVESVRSVPETIVRKKERGKKRVVDVE